jgi:DNA-binding NarL/FixJ family response regulator
MPPARPEILRRIDPVAAAARAPDPVPHPIRVVLASTALIVREGLETIVAANDRMDVVATYGDLEELEAALDVHRPDVVLIDLRGPPPQTEDGIRIARRLRDSRPALGVIVLSERAEIGAAVALLERGSARRGFIVTDRLNRRTQLWAAIDAVAAGGSAIDAKVVEHLVVTSGRLARSPLADLTPRERDVLAGVARGLSNHAIAESLVLTKRAVEKYINAIFMKLELGEDEDVSKRVKAVLLFLAEGPDEDP